MTHHGGKGAVSEKQPEAKLTIDEEVIAAMSDEEFRRFLNIERDPEKEQHKTEVISQLIEHYGDQTFQYGAYQGSVSDMAAQGCPMLEDKIEQGFEAITDWLDAYKVSPEAEEEDDTLQEKKSELNLENKKENPKELVKNKPAEQKEESESIQVKADITPQHPKDDATQKKLSDNQRSLDHQTNTDTPVSTQKPQEHEQSTEATKQSSPPSEKDTEAATLKQDEKSAVDQLPDKAIPSPDLTKEVSASSGDSSKINTKESEPTAIDTILHTEDISAPSTSETFRNTETALDGGAGDSDELTPPTEAIDAIHTRASFEDPPAPISSAEEVSQATPQEELIERPIERPPQDSEIVLAKLSSPSDTPDEDILTHNTQDSGEVYEISKIEEPVDPRDPIEAVLEDSDDHEIAENILSHTNILDTPEDESIVTTKELPEETESTHTTEESVTAIHTSPLPALDESSEIPAPEEVVATEKLKNWREIGAEEPELEKTLAYIISDIQETSSEHDDFTSCEMTTIAIKVEQVQHAIGQLHEAKNQEECKEKLQVVFYELSSLLRLLGYTYPLEKIKQFLQDHGASRLQDLIGYLYETLSHKLHSSKTAVKNLIHSATHIHLGKLATRIIFLFSPQTTVLHSQ